MSDRGRRRVGQRGLRRRLAASAAAAVALVLVLPSGAGAETASETVERSPLMTPKPAVVRDSIWYLRDTPTSGVADQVFQFGNPGDVPLFGDWNGTGSRTPGVFRDGVWYLRNSNSTGTADTTFVFGDPGDTPIVGDWDGDGVETPGVVRGNLWFLRNSNTTGVADITFMYGNPADPPIVGDWNGDGVATPAVGQSPYFKLGAFWEYRDSNTSGGAEHELHCQYERAVPGAWRGAATDVCGFFDPTSGQWTLRTGPFVDDQTVFTYGDPGDIALRWN